MLLIGDFIGSDNPYEGARVFLEVYYFNKNAFL